MNKKMNKKMNRKTWLLIGLFGVILTLALVFAGCGGDLGSAEQNQTGPITNVAETPLVTISPATSIVVTGTDTTLAVTVTVSAGELSPVKWYKASVINAPGEEIAEGTLDNEGKATYTASGASVGNFYYYVEVTNTDESKEVPTVTATSNVAWIRVRDSATPSASAYIMINPGTKYQWVRGFGGMMNGWGNSPAMGQKDIDTAFDPTNGLGLNIFRVMIYPYMDNLFNGQEAAPAKDPETHQFYYTRIKRAKNNYGVQILASPWTPRGEWKENNSRVGGAALKVEHWGDYARHLKDYITRMEDNGVPIDFITLQNEPDIGVSYDGCDWTGEEMRDFVKRWARFIAPKDGPVKIAPGESYQFREVFYEPIYNDFAALDAVDVIAGHLYGGGLRRHNRAIAAGKEIWMTEHLFNTSANYDIDSTWGEVWKMIDEVHDCMTFDFNAYVWWYIKRFYGLVGDGEYGTIDGQILFRGYALSHYAKYAAGKTRINTRALGSVDGSSNVRATAYESDTEITMVLFNKGSAAVNQLNILLPMAVSSASLVITKADSDSQVDTTGKGMQPGTIELTEENTVGVFDLPASSIVSVRFTK